MWNFRRLSVWQRSLAIAVEISRVCRQFPRQDRILSDQMRRAANSIGANIAEGAAKPSGRERARYLSIALGSLSEVEHHLILAMAIGRVDADWAEGLIREVSELRRMTESLRRLALNEDAS